MTDIKQIYLIGGCDGAEANRTYFRDIAVGLPRDSVVLTLGCGKYRMQVSFRLFMLGLYVCTRANVGLMVSSLPFSLPLTDTGTRSPLSPLSEVFLGF